MVIAQGLDGLSRGGDKSTEVMQQVPMREFLVLLHLSALPL